MTTQHEPDWMEWVTVDEAGWHLKPDAPPKIVKAFDAYMGINNDIIIEEE